MLLEQSSSLGFQRRVELKVISIVPNDIRHKGHKVHIESAVPSPHAVVQLRELEKLERLTDGFQLFCTVYLSELWKHVSRPSLVLNRSTKKYFRAVWGLPVASPPKRSVSPRRREEERSTNVVVNTDLSSSTRRVVVGERKMKSEIFR